MYTQKRAKPSRSKFQRHVITLVWKAYLQRQRRWRLLVLEAVFAGIMFAISLLIAKPVFLTTLQAEPEAPLTSADVIASLSDNNIVGYAPDIPPYTSIMATASQRLGISMLSGATEEELNDKLYDLSRGTPLRRPVIWVLWKPTVNNTWQLSIRSTERARYVASAESRSSNPHLRSGFLAVQLAVSEATLSYVSWKPLQYELSLVSMPVSPLMQQARVQRAIAGILLCFILALLPPVLETQALVVTESMNRFKQSLRIRGVAYSSIYLGWLTYAYMTALPICILASITLIQIFRWVHIVLTLIIVLAYISVMIMLALIMALFHRSAVIACTWTTLFTLMQLFLAELIIHHRLDVKDTALTFILHLIIPPLGLEHGFNEFALLQTGETERWKGQSLTYTLLSWLVMILSYFCLLMLLQRTLKDVALGGQVSWKSIIFKKPARTNQLHRVEIPTGHERDKLQEVDELTAKAISMRNVSKGIMGGPILSNVTLDIYRGELTMLFSERIQSKMLTTIEDLLTGLTYPDKGTVNILGEELRPGVNFMSMPYMTGYCHHSSFLVDELTVEEHLVLYCSICLWNESNAYTNAFCHLRTERLLADCNLTAVQNEYIRNLDVYYRAQLCWAIALLLEPRIVILPSLSGNATYRAVIKDKIMEYRGYITIIKSTFTSLILEHADRVFIFDSRLLVFGGTPAYMFFKYGRDYRLRITLRSDMTNEDVLNELLENASKANATIRAHLGSLLILRLPTTPTDVVAKFVKYLSDNSNILGMMSMNISVPDSEEVCSRCGDALCRILGCMGTTILLVSPVKELCCISKRRARQAVAIFESRSVLHTTELEHHLTKTALLKLAESVQWARMRTSCSTYRNLKYIAWKFFTFHTNYRFFCIITVISALVTGVFIGLSFTKVLADVETNRSAKKILHGEVLTVEALEQTTTLILRLDNSSDAKSIATGYVLSETGAKPKEIENVHYTALSRKESLTEYLVTLAIDSPQHYVYMYAYGMDVGVNGSKINVQVLYSPLHQDAGAAARSLARAFTSLVRHATGALDATIRVTDDPLALDLSVWLEEHTKSPFLVQFLLILSISHMTLLPSKESGFIRHVQCNARNSSPACYWFALFLCDLFLYGLLVGLMTAAMVVIMLLVAPSTFSYTELAVLPLLLIIFGAGCIPQAYLFSLSNHTALNTMIYVMINVVFGETTVLAKILYGDALSYALQFLSLSPQFNMGYAFVKIKNIFLYNSECIVFEWKNHCASKMLHKCCPKCGVLQDCFSKRFYLTEGGILMEVIAILLATIVFMVILLLWEYKSIQAFWKYVSSNWIVAKEPVYKPEYLGAARERLDAINKKDELHEKNKRKVLGDSFGEYLLAYNITQIKTETYSLRNVYLGLSRGEALAVSGLKDHGRERLCQILAGYTLSNDGQLWCMSKWRADQDFNLYARQISYCGSPTSLPPWMTVYNGLELMAVLRGVPQGHIHDEVMNYIDALELRYYVNTLIKRVPENCRMRVRFAAAVVGAPPVLILDECTAYQKYSVRRAMYAVISHLRQRGHAVLMSSSSVESHMPVTNRLAILLEGRIYDVDQVDNLVERFGARGYTVVVHLKDDVDVQGMFSKYFDNFIINDTSEVLVNVQVMDSNLNWKTIFEKMEKLQAENWLVYSYIVSAIPIDNIYNNILHNETGRFPVKEKICFLTRFLLPHKKMIAPQANTLSTLKTFDERYSVTKLRQLPWSVIFQR